MIFTITQLEQILSLVNDQVNRCEIAINNLDASLGMREFYVKEESIKLMETHILQIKKKNEEKEMELLVFKRTIEKQIQLNK